MTVRTLSEIAATARKAARGSGCPWGLAEEAGQAVRILESHDLPGVAALATLLSGPRACACDGAAAAPLCGLAEAARLSDRLVPGARDFGTVSGGVLLAAALLSAGRAGQVRIGAARIAVGPERVEMTGPLPHAAAPVSVIVSDAPAHPTESHAAHAVPAAAWATLEALASRTYVPETDASRAAGAGPGGAETD